MFGLFGYPLISSFQLWDGYIEYLIVAGGGGGGFTASNSYEGGGGGGAGGMLTGNTTYTGTFTLTVGAKGLAGGESHPSRDHATDGEDSVALGLTAVGGGHGGYSSPSRETANKHGSPGGSGGGGFGYAGAANGGAGTAGQGNNGGGCGSGHNTGGGGGGGAGGVGGYSGGGSNVKGAAGAGASSSITGSSVTYAQGGQGGLNASGGAGSTTKGGGGGGSGDGAYGGGSDGQNGIVILRVSNKVSMIVTGGLSKPAAQPISGTEEVYYSFETPGTGTVTFYSA